MSPAAGIVIRPSVEQANIVAIRDAYSKMQALMASDNRSWIYWAEFHGFNRYDCWHHASTGPAQESTSPPQYPYDLFLPWHRAYLHAFDHVVRDQNPDAILAWWDWSSNTSHSIGIPSAYAEETVDGSNNPLASGPTPDMPDDPARRTRRFPGDPAELPSQTATTVEGDSDSSPSTRFLHFQCLKTSRTSCRTSMISSIRGWADRIRTIQISVAIWG
jgi:hypothetical protein